MTTSASTSTVVRRRDAAQLARRYARAQCAGHTLPTMVEDVELVVSELVTNAMRHGRGLALVAILAREWGVRPEPGGGKVVWCVLTPAVSG